MNNTEKYHLVLDFLTGYIKSYLIEKLFCIDLIG